MLFAYYIFSAPEKYATIHIVRQCIITVSYKMKLKMVAIELATYIRAVPFKSVGPRRNGRFFEVGRGRILNYFIPLDYT